MHILVGFFVLACMFPLFAYRLAKRLLVGGLLALFAFWLLCSVWAGVNPNVVVTHKDTNFVIDGLRGKHY